MSGQELIPVQEETVFIRLDNISVGYNVPSRWITKLGLGSLRVYANVRNVAVWAPDFKLWDPEMGGNGYYQYPTQRVFNIGIQFNFN